MKLNTDEEIWNGLIGDIYPHLYYRAYDWEYFVTFIDKILKEQRKDKTKIKVLDTASGGCGEPAVTLSRYGYQVWATDGFDKMLNKAIRIAEFKNINIKFTDRPVKFSELRNFYDKYFFDYIFCVANSISHVPDGQLNNVLLAMVSVLGHEGTIILDTKRYTNDGKEIEYDTNEKKSKIRITKEVPLRIRMYKKEIVKISTSFTHLDGIDAIYHIEIHYSDGRIDPFSLQFWRYTSERLKDELKRIGLQAKIVSPDISRWKYEIIIGKSNDI
jgi:SAM-dependent methyltransferase